MEDCMAKIRTPRFKLSRRLGVNIYRICAENPLLEVWDGLANNNFQLL